MRQVTLVAFYGKKPNALAGLIRECHERIAARFGKSFSAYETMQIHATVVGLERRPHSLYNRNISQYREELSKMDLHGFRAFLLGAGHLPFTVQVGGFRPDAKFFESRGETPYLRSFSIQNRIAVIMGWPLRGRPLIGPSATSAQIRAYPDTLNTVRRAAQSFNIQHQWHKQPTDVDNDFYFRLGLFESRPSESDVRSTEEELRTFLAEREPLVQEVRTGDLQFVTYEECDETLPWDRCATTPLTNAGDPYLLFD